MSNFEPISKDVSGLQFSILSPEEIRKQSVVEITKHETFDKDTSLLLRVYLIVEWVLLK